MTRSAVRSPRSSQNSATRSSRTGSASCTASRRASTTSPRSCPRPPGFLIEKEVEVLDRLTENPERPYTVVLGGSKVSDKLGVIEHLLPRVDRLLVGGGMMFTFLAAEGHKVGSSLLEAGSARHGQAATSPRRRSGASSSCSPSTRWSRHPSRRMPSTSIAPASAIEDTRVRRVGAGPGHRTRDGGAVRRGRSATRRRCSGTARWACSRCRPSPRARRPSPKALTEVDGLSRSSAAATRPPRCVSSASPTTSSATSPPAGARASSSSKARSFPDWRSSDGSMQHARRSSQATGR